MSAGTRLCANWPHRAEALRDFQQLRRSISTNVVERVKTRMPKKIEADFAPRMFPEIDSSTNDSRCVSPCEQLVFETLQARASTFSGD